ncbi:hypothetical protein [Thalassoglobus sp.]|uniref:hypothetical protein n=1 Tax=Thalassoglobus sp. TaxID=2795869 RepID=UPI003AA95DCE
MKRIHLLAMAVCLIPAVTANAQSQRQMPQQFPQQFPQQNQQLQSQQPQIQQTRGIKAQVEKVNDAVADAYAQQHVNANSYSGHVYSGGGGQYYGGHGGAANYYGGAYCQQYGCDLNCYPRHNYTYGYQRPKHLVYPQQNATGGAVVYPYYTHKGPSDFFRK